MSDFVVIENSIKGMNEYGHCYGSEVYKITKDDIQALLDGKMLASTINCNEYSIFVTMEVEDNAEN